MYNDMVDDEIPTIDIDPVTNAPRGRRASTSHDRRRSGGYYGVPIPVPAPVAAGRLSPSGSPYGSPYGSPSNYFTGSPYLSPTSLPSPQLAPQSWIDSYYNQFGDRIPISADDRRERSPQRSPRRRHYQLPSPQHSPYLNVIPLPLAPSEPAYDDPRDSWASRFRNWITGEGRPDPHRQLLQKIQINAAFDYKASGITWNMTYSPHSVRLKRSVNPDGSAFSPPLSTCRIVTPLIPWLIEIRARDGAEYITNMSLLTDIYHCFKKPIDREIYDRLPTPFRMLVDETYRRRCDAIPDEDAAAVAFRQGIRRIDFLLDKCLFIGLSQVKDTYQTFEMRIVTD